MQPATVEGRMMEKYMVSIWLAEKRVIYYTGGGKRSKFLRVMVE